MITLPGYGFIKQEKFSKGSLDREIPQFDASGSPITKVTTGHLLFDCLEPVFEVETPTGFHYVHAITHCVYETKLGTNELIQQSYLAGRTSVLQEGA